VGLAHIPFGAKDSVWQECASKKAEGHRETLERGWTRDVSLDTINQILPSIPLIEDIDVVV
jgi:hypothetical protein